MTELKIKDVSQDLMVDVIKTLPISPVYFRMIMVANGIECVDPAILLSRAEHSRACEANKRIPYSTFKFEYDSAFDLFLPRGSSQNTLPIVNNHLTVEEKRQAVDSFVRNGHFYELEIIVENDSEKAFDNFRTGFLEVLSDSKYNFAYGDMQFAIFRKSENVSELTASLEFDILGYKKDKSVILMSGPAYPDQLSRFAELSDNDRIKLVNWFKNLAKTYEAQ